jgi:hypothetical protein
MPEPLRLGEGAGKQGGTSSFKSGQKLAFSKAFALLLTFGKHALAPKKILA